jgi:hypothetical protein
MTPNEREDLRIKMVALLYGELPEEQVESVRSAIEMDPELSVEFAQWNAVRGAIAENIDDEAPAARVRESVMAAARDAIERRHAVVAPAEKETPRWLLWLEQLGAAPAFAGFGIVVLAAGLLYTVTQEYSDEGLATPSTATLEAPRVEKGSLETEPVVAPAKKPEKHEKELMAEVEPNRRLDSLSGNLNEGAFGDQVIGSGAGEPSNRAKSLGRKKGVSAEKAVAFGSGGLGSRGTGAGGGGLAIKKAARKRSKSARKAVAPVRAQAKKKEVGVSAAPVKQSSVQRQARSAPAFAPPPPAPESAMGASDSAKETKSVRRDRAPSAGVLHGADADSSDQANLKRRPAPSRRAKARAPSRAPQPSAAPAPTTAPASAAAQRSSTRVGFAEAKREEEALEDEGSVAEAAPEAAPEADLEPQLDPRPAVAQKARSGGSRVLRTARSRAVVGTVESSGSCEPSEARDWLKRMIPGIRQCHRTQLLSRPETAGVVGLSWRVENDGRPKDVRVDQTKLRSDSADLSSCLVKVVSNAGSRLFGARAKACTVRSTVVLKVIRTGRKPGARPAKDVGEAEGRGF